MNLQQPAQFTANNCTNDSNSSQPLHAPLERLLHPGQNGIRASLVFYHSGTLLLSGVFYPREHLRCMSIALPRYQDHTFTSSQRCGRSTNSICVCGERHGNQHIPTPPTPPLGNPLGTQLAALDLGGSSSSHNSRPLSARGVHDQSDPNTGPQGPACNSPDSQIPKSQPSTTDQTLTASGVMRNRDNPDPTIQISSRNNPEPQSGHTHWNYRRSTTTLPRATWGTCTSSTGEKTPPGAIVGGPLQHPNERFQLSAPHDVIWTNWLPTQVCSMPLIILE